MHNLNLEVSADLPYGVINYLKDDFNMIVFTNGSAGNLSTRFTRSNTSFEELERLGSRLGQSVKKSISNPVYKGEIYHFKIQRFSKKLLVRKFLDFDTAKDNLEHYKNQLFSFKDMKKSNKEIKLAEALYDGAKVEFRFSQIKNSLKFLNIEISIIEINDLVFITIPGEIFSDLTKSIRDMPNHFIISYTNGYNLYFASNEAYENNYYESSLSLLKQGESEKLILFILEKLQLKVSTK